MIDELYVARRRFPNLCLKDPIQVFFGSDSGEWSPEISIMITLSESQKNTNHGAFSNNIYVLE